MPTGYTNPVKTGEIADFRTFALRCARNFGALIVMRDEPMDAPIPDEFSVSEYARDRVDETRARMLRAEDMTPTEAEAAAKREHEAGLEAWRRAEAERERTRERYGAMLGEVRAWEPPSTDHEELKSFMVEQLTGSLRFDCGEPLGWTAPERLDGEAWLEDELDEARRMYESAVESLEKERERVAGRNEWVRQLRNSLP